MKAQVWHRGGIALVLISGPMITFVAPARAQSEAVTQFAPLDDSPIPTPPNVREPQPVAPNAAPRNEALQEARHAPDATPTAPSAPEAFVSQPTSSESSSGPDATTPSPMVGSTWLGAKAANSKPVAASANVSRPAPAPVDSGLPVFVAPSSAPNRDVATSEPPPEDDETHRVAATFSLARAFLLPAVVPGEVKNAALYEGTIELKVFERLSVAVLGGVGSFDVPLSQLGKNVHVKGKELGGQARLYVFGDFDHGLSIGAEYLRVWAEADPINVEAVPPPPLPPGTGVLTGEATLSGLGAFLGYKVTAGFGLTADAKLGIQQLTADGEGSVSGEIGPGYPTLTESESFHYNQLVPLVNVNVGWAI